MPEYVAQAGAGIGQTPEAAARQPLAHPLPRPRLLTDAGGEAYVHPRATPLAAREWNRAAVAQLLQHLGIGSFAVRGKSDHGAAVAVLEDDRMRFLEGLSRYLGHYPGHLTPLREPHLRAPRPLPSGDREAWSELGSAMGVQVSWYQTDPGGHILLGHEYGCAVEFWRREGDRLVAPRPNRIAFSVAAAGPNVWGRARLFSRFVSDSTPRESAPPLATRPEFLVPAVEDIEFPVDAVYTWVDGNDPLWAARKASAKGEAYHAESASDARFISRDELRYSMRSLHLFAPWIRNVYVVTDDQVPAWMRTDVPGFQVVSHREIFRNPADLPTFNSHSIESQLHHIPGLAEHFLYFNDDMFIGRPVNPHTFFTPGGTAKYFPSRNRIPQGPVVETDTPVDAACKNNRALLLERFGRVITQPMEHIPYALRRSAMEEAEADFPQAWQRTAASRFRAMTDLSPTSSFTLYYAALTGRAQPGSMRYTYLQLSVPDLADRLQRLLDGRGQDSFCLNDAYSTPEDLEAQTEALGGFLGAYFPTPSPCEH